MFLLKRPKIVQVARETLKSLLSLLSSTLKKVVSSTNYVNTSELIKALSWEYEPEFDDMPFVVSNELLWPIICKVKRITQGQSATAFFEWGAK